jgi:multidrug efflux system membrane fusion protein
MRLLDAGNIVHASDATGLVIINQIDPIAVMFTLPEGEFQRVNQAMQTANAPLTVEALARDDGSTLGSGHLLLLNNQIDASTGTFQLKALFPNPNHKLWPGQYVDARLMLGVRSGAVTVPASALQRGPDGLLIYVVHADATVAAQPVRVGQTQQGKALIESGLAAGTRVVIDGQYKIRPGVTISEAPKSPAAPPGTRP